MLSFAKRHLREITIFIIAAVLIAALSVFGYRRHVRNVVNQAYAVNPISTAQLQQAAASSADKLMIVAHPDDEVLWGGGHLYEKGYLVVCVTNGRNEVRSKEFKDVVKASGNDCIMLEYPDKVRGQRDDWQLVENGIKSDLEKIMTCKKWKLIAVHNKKGEYGHIHHINVHRYVTDVYDSEDIDCDLYCFGKYYKKSQIDAVKDSIPKISQEQYDFKKKLADMYTSQKKTVDKLWHMAWFEDWTLYKRYSDNPEYDPADKADNNTIGAAINEAKTVTNSTDSTKKDKP